MAASAPYLVSARKYRPATFRSVVGQKALTSTLKNAIASNRLGQAYLFTGPRGVGKTSCARIFAKTINCLSPNPDGEACGKCDSCRAVDLGNSFDLTELDAASNNSVEDIRLLNEQVYVPAQVGKYRIFIIDEVHMLSSNAFNAFLKTLEEPPQNVIFILATTEKHKVIPTILSRCQIYDFKRITIQDIVDHLQYVASEEGIEVETEALGVIARKADGAMRDALSIFDQVTASCAGHITYQATIENLNVLDYEYYFRLIDAFRTGDVATALLIYQDIRDKGFDSHFFLNGLAGHVRDLMVAADPRTVPLLETAEDVGKRYVDQARSLPLNWYYAALRLLTDSDLAYRAASSKRLLVELTLIRLSQLLTPATPPFDAVDNTPPLRSPETTPRPTSGPASAPSSSPAYPSPAVVPPAPQAAHEPNPETSVTSDIAARSTAKRTAPKKVTPAPTQSVKKAGASPLPSVSISKPTSPRTGEETGERREPVTAEAFSEAWARFIANNPAKHILISAMRSAAPHQVGNEAFEVAVEHPASVQAFEAEMPQLIAFLRNAVSNDRITLSVTLSEIPESAKTLPPKEFLKKIVDTNPVLAAALRNMEGELGS